MAVHHGRRLSLGSFAHTRQQLISALCLKEWQPWRQVSPCTTRNNQTLRDCLLPTKSPRGQTKPRFWAHLDHIRWCATTMRGARFSTLDSPEWWYAHFNGPAWSAFGKFG